MARARQVIKVALGSLPRGRVFWAAGRRFKVEANLGVAGVAVRALMPRRVRLAGRSFLAHDRRQEVWSAACEVEVRRFWRLPLTTHRSPLTEQSCCATG